MDDLGNQERAVLDLIAANPFVGQQEIATSLGLARSTIAAHIVQLTRKGYILGRGYVLPEASRAVCIGGAVLDRKFRALAPILPATSNPVEGFRSLGGVARNVAENLSCLGTETSFISIVGNDETGREILGLMRQRGIDVSQVIISDEGSTAEYIALLGPDQELSVAAANMRIFELFVPELLDRIWPHLASAQWVFADCNLPAATLAVLIARKRGARFQLAVDAVSMPKAMRLPADLSGIDLLFMNLDEANAYLQRTSGATLEDATAAARGLQDRGAAEAIVTLGALGTACATREEGVATIAAVAARPLDITGAGDAMIAGTLHRVMSGQPTAAAARVGALLGALTTETTATVHPSLSAHFLDANLHRLDP